MPVPLPRYSVASRPDAGGAQTGRCRRPRRPPRSRPRRRGGPSATRRRCRRRARHAGRRRRPCALRRQPRLERCAATGRRSRGASTRRCDSSLPSRCGRSSRARPSARTTRGCGSRATPAAPELSLALDAPDELHDLAIRQATVSRHVEAARNLANRPANDLNPVALAAARSPASRSTHVSVEHHGRDWIDAQGMGALAAVAAGSGEEPQLIVLRYDPPGASSELVARPRRQGDHVRLRRRLAEAAAAHAGHEGRHGRRGCRARGHRRGRRARAAAPRRSPSSPPPRTCSRQRRSGRGTCCAPRTGRRSR